MPRCQKIQNGRKCRPWSDCFCLSATKDHYGIFLSLMTKPMEWHVCSAKTQISLSIPQVWSASWLCAQWVANDPSCHHADSEDWSDWADAQADLSLCWALMPYCWFCHDAAQLVYEDIHVNELTPRAYDYIKQIFVPLQEDINMSLYLHDCL